MYPAYLDAYDNGKLKQAADKTTKLLTCCSLCPRKCQVNRLKEELGYCKTGSKAIVYSFLPHHGEEPPISGTGGSGTIFFAHCNMACVYCQNYEFSQRGQGRAIEAKDLAKIMLQLQKQGTHNINLVSPTHVLPQILQALLVAVPQGLRLPLVYNTGGYELAAVIKLLEGIVDIYLPDIRYVDNKAALRYSDAPDYPQYNQEAIKEMQQQVGVACINPQGILTRGLIVRHLVLPNDICGTDKIMQFISQEVSPQTYLSLMSQYLPYYKATDCKEIARRLTSQEYQTAKGLMEKYGLHNGWIQESYGLERFAGVNIKPALKENEHL
jgi:putative pyruvate formate lyase activating enzyme